MNQPRHSAIFKLWITFNPVLAVEDAIFSWYTIKVMNCNPVKTILFGLALIFLLGLFQFSPIAAAEEKTINIYFFNSDTCPHCAREEIFLEKFKQENNNINVVSLEVTKNKENLKLLRKVAEKLELNISSVPFTVVGNLYLSGWQDEGVSGAHLRQMVLFSMERNQPDIVGQLMESENNSKPALSNLPEKIKLPFIGEAALKNFSLPVLSVVVGALDGFNPCAMWVLLFLIGLLLGMKNRKRMWILGSAFIVASAAVYFILMAAWLNLLLFVGFVVWIRMLIALVALISGGYYLKSYFTVPPGTCDAASGKKQQKTFDKLKGFVQEKNFWLALGGIILLAFAVNLVEAICSAGLPVIYTQVLTLAGLPTWQYYAYLLLYNFFFMLDDLIVFFVAMFTLQTLAFTGKYSHISRLIGGILMIIIGFLLFFRPEWLMF